MNTSIKTGVLAGVMSGVLVVGMASASASSHADVIVYDGSNGEHVVTSSYGGKYIDDNGRIMAPIRALGEAMSCKVEWDEGNRQAVLTRYDPANGDKYTVYIPLGQKYVSTIINDDYNNTYVQWMDTYSVSVDGRIYIPVRYTAEAFDFDVSWDSNEHVATCSHR